MSRRRGGAQNNPREGLLPHLAFQASGGGSLCRARCGRRGAERRSAAERGCCSPCCRGAHQRAGQCRTLTSRRFSALSSRPLRKVRCPLSTSRSSAFFLELALVLFENPNSPYSPLSARRDRKVVRRVRGCLRHEAVPSIFALVLSPQLQGPWNSGERVQTPCDYSVLAALALQHPRRWAEGRRPNTSNIQGDAAIHQPPQLLGACTPTHTLARLQLHPASRERRINTG